MSRRQRKPKRGTFCNKASKEKSTGEYGDGQQTCKYPKHENKTCYGHDFTVESAESYRQSQLNLSWLIEFYNNTSDKKEFFTSSDFFNKLAGNSILQEQIKVGLPETQIRQTWQAKLQIFKDKRKKYLLYADFE